jgi:hypothetical protein
VFGAVGASSKEFSDFDQGRTSPGAGIRLVLHHRDTRLRITDQPPDVTIGAFVENSCHAFSTRLSPRGSDWRWHQLSINPDSHSIRELDHMHWGVEIARKGGVPADRVLNALSLPQLLKHLRRRR